MTASSRSLLSPSLMTSIWSSTVFTTGFSVLRSSPHQITVHQSSLSHPSAPPKNSVSFKQQTTVHPPVPHPSNVPPIRTSPPTMVNPSIASMPKSRRVLYADKILDGVSVSKQILTEIREEVYTLLSDKVITRPPQLAIILVGDAPDSVSYVRRKIQACTQVGFRNTKFHQLPCNTDQKDVLSLIHELNEDDSVDGILVQLPLPKHYNLSLIQQSISPSKDVDVFHPQNRANFLHYYNPFSPSAYQKQYFVPPTPQACIELLTRYKIPIAGKNIVVVGKSQLVGEPIAILLRKYGGNVTSCDDKTPNIQSITSQADILVSATGQAELVRPTWIKPGCVVLDVGITVTPAPCSAEAPSTPNPTSVSPTPTSPYSPFPIYTPTPALVSNSKQLQVRGDVAFLEVLPIVSKITPVPGGIGPTTVAALLRNTLISARNSSPQSESLTE